MSTILSTFLKSDSTNPVSKWQIAAGHDRFRIWCVVNGSDSVTWIQQPELFLLSAQQELRKNIAKAGVDKKNGVELCDIEIWVPSLFYCHFPTLIYLCLINYSCGHANGRDCGCEAAKAFMTPTKWSRPLQFLEYVLLLLIISPKMIRENCK